MRYMHLKTALVVVVLLTGGIPALAEAQPQTVPAPATRPAQWAQPLQVEGVPNLHRVSPVLYRSAQPTNEGMKQLKAMGIKTVVNLRSFHSDRDELKGTGLQYEHIYMKAWNAEREEAVRFLQIVMNPENQPVLVHCQHGADRTGTMCAVYRMAVQGWSKQQAVEEMTEGGYGFHEVWANLKRWLDSVDVQELRREAGIR